MGVKPEAWKSYPTVDWARGVSKTVTGFMNLFDTIEERGYTTTKFAFNSMILRSGVKSMVDIARMLWLGKKFFTAKIDPNFVQNLSKNLLGFGKLALMLDKMLISEKTVTTKRRGFFGMTTTTETVRERKDLSLVKEMEIVELIYRSVISLLISHKEWIRAL